ncbi:hypothetical protein GYMLUDRAFT_245442 [Collybiopsis luxurians FD-317 M1]|uniref:Unplaced genomic scaffold GYMLUscaffold_32, whole genome shotgun sequence n=1 Tax=Collybiopsis luxurians FD-317 M1 TaxID=944289 RepID=A0A0D0CA84_9AGAR|nr:hypothetical protein GYMLUDRAFT_245442 [Collybiopsis luxurians FD-317 M1]
MLWSWLRSFSALTLSLHLVSQTALLVGAITLRNITVDDSDPSWIYLPYGAWNIGNTCQGCQAQPNASLVYNRTWHDSAFYAPPNQQTMSYPNVPFTASIFFYGTAVYVYCIILNSVTTPIFGESDMAFYVDNVQVNTYRNSPTENLGTYNYNVPVFSLSSLEFNLHNLTIQNGVANGTNALILLDYIAYTADATVANTSLPSATSPVSTSSATSSSNTPGPPAVSSNSFLGVEIAVPLALFLLIVIVSLYLWRKHCLLKLEIESRPSPNPLLTSTLPSPLPQKYNGVLLSVTPISPYRDSTLLSPSGYESGPLPPAYQDLRV